jgi:hypothetical protein
MICLHSLISRVEGIQRLAVSVLLEQRRMRSVKNRAKDEGDDELQRRKLQDAEGCGQDAKAETW